MDFEHLEYLCNCACYARIIEIDNLACGFLIAMDHNATYDNENFDWFKQRYPSFCYIDRIVINKEFAARGLGPRFYDDLYLFAKTQELEALTCEYNIEPLNVPSQKFHDSFGFIEVGKRVLEAKTVSMQLRNFT